MDKGGETVFLNRKNKDMVRVYNYTYTGSHASSGVINFMCKCILPYVILICHSQKIFHATVNYRISVEF